MKKVLFLLIAAVLFLGLSASAQATLVDLTVDESGGPINGAYFVRYDDKFAGRGVFPTFLSMQHDGGSDFSAGYNTDYRYKGGDKTEFQADSATPHNHSVSLSSLSVVDYLGLGSFYAFTLDADQTGVIPYLTLADLEIYQTNDPNLHDYATSFPSPVYDLGNGNSVLVDWRISGGGSGWADMVALIPVGAFDPDLEFVVLYSEFTGDNDGPQEWSYFEESFKVPEPSSMLLIGFGLLGLAGISRKKFLKK